MSGKDIVKDSVIVNYQSGEDQESLDSKQKNIYLPDFFQDEFPYLTKFLNDRLISPVRVADKKE